MSAFLALLSGGIAIGFAGIFMRLSDVNPIASAFWRMALASPLLWAACLAERGRAKPFGRGAVARQRLAMWAGACFAGDLAFWHSSLHLTTVANATLLSNLAPVFIAAWLLLAHRVRFRPVFLVGMVVTLVGAALLVVPNAASAGHDTRLTGDLLGLASAVFYGAYQLVVKQARAAQSTARVMAWSSTVSAVLLLPLAWITPGPLIPSSWAGWLPLLGLAVVAQIGGQTVIAYALAHLPAALSSVSLLVQPLTAAIAAWLLFHETLQPAQFLGAALVVVGIAAAKRSSEPSEPSPRD